jgi:hypothetical protein
LNEGEKTGEKAYEFEYLSQGSKKNAYSFDQQEKNVAWDDRWKMMGLNWDV